MSRIGNRILQIPEKVTVSVDGNIVKVTGPKGELSTEINPNITVNIKDNEVVVERKNDNFKNFAFTPNGFTVYFNRYQVAPYSYGSFYIIIPYSELNINRRS